jgi:hypothetical protein
MGSGYKNLIPKDPKVHSDAAKGRKQPQRIGMSSGRIGKVHTTTTPNVKLKQIGGDNDWESYGGQFIVDEKFNNGDFDYYLVIQFENLKESMGYEADHKYMVIINSVAPSLVSEQDLKGAFESMGVDDPTEQERIRKDQKAIAGILSEYGLSAPLFNDVGDNAKKLMDEAKKQGPTITGLYGFYMDKPVNRLGNTGWDFIKGNIGLKPKQDED